MSGNRVLLVDDAPVVRAMLKELLEEYGFVVVGEAGSGDEALIKYKECKPDVVTMDITMPGVDGLHGLKNILAYDPKAKVIMVTALDQKDTLAQAIRVGAADYVIKPFEVKRIISAVSKAVQKEP
jgi:two-component system chemotaxis response regulator CheY